MPDEPPSQPPPPPAPKRGALVPPPLQEESKAPSDPPLALTPTGRHRPLHLEDIALITPEAPKPVVRTAGGGVRPLTERELDVLRSHAARELAAPAVSHSPSGIPSDPPKNGARSHVAVQVVDRFGDVVGTICVTYLCLAGKITGTEALITICALLGALQGIRRLNPRGGTGGLLAITLGGAGAAFGQLNRYISGAIGGG